MQPEKLIPMAYVRCATGIKGWLKIKADTEYVDSLLDYPRWFLGKNNQWAEYSPESGKVTPDGLQVKLHGVEDRNAAELLRGMTIAVPREDFPEAEEGEHYWVDLVGMTATNAKGDVLGVVTRLQASGAHDLLEVAGKTNTMLIPFVPRYILSVSYETNTITTDWEVDYS